MGISNESNSSYLRHHCWKSTRIQIKLICWWNPTFCLEDQWDWFHPCQIWLITSAAFLAYRQIDRDPKHRFTCLFSAFGLKLLFKTWRLLQSLGLLFGSVFYLWSPSVTAHLVLTRHTPPSHRSSGNAESCRKDFLTKNTHSGPGLGQKREENCRELGEAAPVQLLRIYLLSAGKFVWFWCWLQVFSSAVPWAMPLDLGGPWQHPQESPELVILAQGKFYNPRALRKHPKLSQSSFSLFSFSIFLVILFLFPTLRVKAGEWKTWLKDEEGDKEKEEQAQMTGGKKTPLYFFHLYLIFLYFLPFFSLCSVPIWSQGTAE